MKRLFCCIFAVMLVFGNICSAEANAAQDINTDESANTVNIYVDAAKETDGENVYASIREAMAAAEKIDKREYKVIVTIKGGTYNVSETLAFTSKDSGSEKYPVVYKAADGEKVIFNAGKKANGTKPDAKDPIIGRFPASVKNKIYKIDLSDFSDKELGSLPLDGVPDLGHEDAERFGGFAELIYDGEVMKKAAYPNIGSKYISSAQGDNNAKMFLLDGGNDIPASWNPTGDGIVACIASSGYVWSETAFRGIDSATGMIKTEGKSAGIYGAGARVRFWNLPELIDQPGEYCIYTPGKCAYFYPPDESIIHDLYVTKLKTPIISAEDAENIIFEGITVENGAETGIFINKSTNIEFKNCVVKNIGGTGIKVRQDKNVKISDSTVKDIGCYGIMLSYGGVAKTLTSSGNVVENCDVYSVGRQSAVGELGIVLQSETGATVRNCRVHNTPHYAIRLKYDDTISTIEKNEVYNAVNDTYDAGAIYCGASYFEGVGSVFKNNYIHDIRLSKDARGGAVVGLYLDDQMSGVTAEGNIFADNAFCMLVGGGDWNTIKNNVFYKSNASLTYDNRGQGWQKLADGSAKKNFYDEKIGVGNYLWDERFPYTKTYYEYLKANDMDKVNAPDKARIEDNYIIGTADFSLAASVTENAENISDNYKTSEDIFGFEAPENYNFKYDKSKKLSGTKDFEYIDFDEIGLREKKNLGKAQPVGPKNGAENIEGNCAVLSWKDCNGADKFRVRISMNKDFTALIYDETVLGRSVELNNLKYGKTFYWTVEPIVSSKSEFGGEVSNVYSFTTAKNEKKNTKELESLLNNLGTGWKRVAEGKRPGMYEEGAVAELSEAVDEAETVLYNNASKMFSIKNATAKLNNAINAFNNKMITESVDLGEWLKDKSSWNTSSKEFTQDSLHLKAENAGYGNAQLSRGQLLKFKAKFDLTGFQGWGFNLSETNKAFWDDTGYSVVIKRDVFEIQKRYRRNGSLNAEMIKTFANEESILTSNIWYTIETGVISTAIGPRIVIKVDGKTVVDYVDTSENCPDELGYFSFSDASGVDGLYIAGADYKTE